MAVVGSSLCKPYILFGAILIPVYLLSGQDGISISLNTKVCQVN